MTRIMPGSMYRALKPIWNWSLNFITQSCHLAWGQVIPLFFSLIIGSWLGPWWGIGIACSLFAPAMLFKEMCLDVPLEEATPASQFMDWCFYMAGMFLSVLEAIAIFWLFGRL